VRKYPVLLPPWHSEETILLQPDQASSGPSFSSRERRVEASRLLKGRQKNVEGAGGPLFSLMHPLMTLAILPCLMRMSH
jgi:hypothetical protein